MPKRGLKRKLAGAAAPKGKRRKKSAPRLQAKNAFLTYPRCPLEPEFLLEHMSALATIEQ